MAIPNPLGLPTTQERGPDAERARVPTTRAAFIGRTLRGPLDTPILIRSFAEFQHVFGGLWQPSTLAYAVEHFFDNGGREALIVRVANGARASSLRLRAGSGEIRLRAASPGTREFLRASVDYDHVPAEDRQRFNLTIQRVRVPGGNYVEDQEIFPLLSVDPLGERFVAEVLERSELVRLEGPAPAERPERTLDADRVAIAYVASSADGDDGAPLTDYDLIGSELARTGLHALDAVEHFNFLVLPPLTRELDVGPCAWLAALNYCRARRALVLLDPPSTWHTADEALRALREFPYASENALMYFPRVLAHDKLRGHFESFAPCGAAAGLLARAEEAGPFWSAGRSEEAVLRPGYRPVCLVSEDRRARLEAKGVNALQAVRSVTRIGVRARTLAAGTASSADAQSLSARRLALFIVNSVASATRWALEEPQLGAEQVGRAVHDARRFLETLHAEGAFGARAIEHSFFVRARLAGETDLQIVLGFIGAGGRDFHVYRIVHSTAGTQVRPVSFDRRGLLEYCPEELEWVERLARELQGS